MGDFENTPHLENTVSDVTGEQIQVALDGILRAEEFRQAKRLREFLAYVVAETQADRQALISARTIAQDVYQRGRGDSDTDLSVVRVDAGRLRRRLAEYYAQSGQQDPVKIVIPTGSYAPEFKIQAQPEIPAEADQPANVSLARRRIVLALAAIAVVLVGLLVNNFLSNNATIKAAQEASIQAAVRRSLLQKSPMTLQAVNQAEQARGLMYPAPDPMRLQLVLQMFEHVITLDGSYFGGFAGAAQVSGLLAGLMPDGPARDAMMQKAIVYSDKAREMRPESSWAQSSAAWVAMVQRDFDTATQLANMSLSLDTDDLFAREVASLVFLFAGDFQRAADLSNPQYYSDVGAARQTNHNVHGVAQFHLGNAPEAIKQLETVIEQGDPISEISIFYLAAAHQMVGDDQAARAFVSYHDTAWPDGRVDLLLRRIFSDPALLDEPTRLFRAAGGFAGG